MNSGQTSIQCGGHCDSVVQLSYSKECGSGYYLASAGLDGYAMLRRGCTGEFIGTFEGHTDGVTGVSLNGNATILASSSSDGTARIWDAVTGEQLKRFRHPGQVTCVSLDADSTRLVTGCRSSDHYVTLFDVERSDKAPLDSFQGHTRGVRNVIFCRDDRALLTSSYDRTVRMWDRLSGQETNSVELPHHAKSLELHRDGKTVTLSYGTSMVFLDVDKFEVLTHRKMGFKVAGATLHPFKESYVCACSNGRIFKYDYITGALLDIYSLMGVNCVSFSPDGEKCASASGTGHITIWQQNCHSSEWEDEDESMG